MNKNKFLRIPFIINDEKLKEWYGVGKRKCWLIRISVGRYEELEFPIKNRFIPRIFFRFRTAFLHLCRGNCDSMKRRFLYKFMNIKSLFSWITFSDYWIDILLTFFSILYFCDRGHDFWKVAAFSFFRYRKFFVKNVGVSLRICARSFLVISPRFARYFGDIKPVFRDLHDQFATCTTI